MNIRPRCRSRGLWSERIFRQSSIRKTASYIPTARWSPSSKGTESGRLSFTSMIHSCGIPLKIRLSIMIFYFLCPYTVVSQTANCDVSTYGKPEKSDCSTLFEKVTSSQNLQARFFDEEQLRADSNMNWPGVANVFQQPIVQLPKFYAMSTFIRIFREHVCDFKSRNDKTRQQIPATSRSCHIRILQPDRSDR